VDKRTTEEKLEKLSEKRWNGRSSGNYSGKVGGGEIRVVTFKVVRPCASGTRRGWSVNGVRSKGASEYAKC